MPALPDSFWRELAADNTSGASAIYQRVVATLAQYLAELAHARAALPNWSQLLRTLLHAQPIMAPLYNLANALALCFEKQNLPEAERLAQALAFLRAELLQTEPREQLLARQALAQLTARPRVLTHSYSGTVAAALEYAFANGAKLEVYLSEARPANEGVRLAERLARCRIPVHFFVDDARARFMQCADLVLLGADRIGEQILLNKIGTRSLALLAAEHKIPIALVATWNKLWPATLPFGTEPAHAEPEHWPRAPNNISLHNFYFEEIALPHAQCVITEKGIFTARELAARLQHFPAAEFWRTT